MDLAMADSREILVAVVREYELATAQTSDSWWRVCLLLLRKEAGEGRHADYKENPDTGVPTIYVYGDGSHRDGDDALAAAEASLDPISDLVYLAHELGHHHLRLGRPTAPKNALRQYEEEVLAWAIGRHLLATRQFEEWDRFCEERRSALEGYRKGLHIDDQQARAIEFQLFGTSLATA
jgi:hypothetical protein